MSKASALLEGLSEQDQAQLHLLSREALEADLKRLVVMQAQVGAVKDVSKIRPSQTDALVDQVDGALKLQLERHPRLAKPLAAIRALARRQEDPAAAGELAEVRSVLATSAVRVARTEEEAARLEDPTSLRTMLAKESRKGRELESMELDNRPPQLANEIVGQGAAAALSSRADPKVVPATVLTQYLQRGRDFRQVGNPQRIAFVDYGSRLQTDRSFDGAAVKAMVAIAEARGWESMKVTGSEAFRRNVWFEAATRGIAVSGYKPTEADKVSAASAAERSGRLNRIEQNPASKAYLGARDGADRMQAAKEHPELKKAFALEEAMRRFADQKLPQGQRDAFLERQRRNIAKDLADGVAMPDIRVRQRRQQLQDREAVAER